MIGRQSSNDLGMYSWIDALSDGKDQGMAVDAESGNGVSARRGSSYGREEGNLSDNRRRAGRLGLSECLRHFWTL